MPEIAAIYGHYVRTALATFETEPPDAAEMARRLRHVLERGLPYLVAELEGRVAGYAYAAPYRPRPAYRFTVENSVYVHPACQRKGLGRLLLTELIAGCEAAGCRQMVAVIGDSGNAASIGLHERWGSGAWECCGAWAALKISAGLLAARIIASSRASTSRR